MTKKQNTLLSLKDCEEISVLSLLQHFFCCRLRMTLRHTKTSTVSTGVKCSKQQSGRQIHMFLHHSSKHTSYINQIYPYRVQPCAARLAKGQPAARAAAAIAAASLEAGAVVGGGTGSACSKRAAIGHSARAILYL